MTERNGYTLIEGLITTLILVTGLAAVAGVFSYSSLRSSQVLQETAAIALISAKMEDLKAAEQSHAGAQFNLGTMYAQGQGVPADKARSIMWIDRAARLGNAAAQHALGIVYLRASLERKAENPSESRIEAYKWLQLAAMQGCRNSDTAASALTFQMTHKDVADGNRRVATFVGAASDAGPGAVISTAGEAYPMTSDSSAHTL